MLELALKYRTELGFTSSEITELYAFCSYAVAYPNNFLALVDSYDTLNSGVKNFLCVAMALEELGYKPIGIRLDSGDLARLSKESKKMFKQVGTKYGKECMYIVVASNDLNEKTIVKLNE